MYDKLRGKFVPGILTHRSSVGHSHVLPPKLKNNESAYAVLHRLLQKAAMRLRHLGYYAGALGVMVRYKIVNPEEDKPLSRRSGFSHWNSGKMKWKDYITFTYTQNTVELIKAFNIMWDRNPFMENIPTAVAVVLFNLSHKDFVTLPIFENYEKNKALYGAIDLLNRRYGNSSVYFGGSHTAKYSAPMRIAFTQIPDLSIEDDEKKDGFGFKSQNSKVNPPEADQILYDEYNQEQFLTDTVFD